MALNVWRATHTVEFQSVWTDGSMQTMQTQIRLLLREQSDQGLHCLPFSDSFGLIIALQNQIVPSSRQCRHLFKVSLFF